MTSSSPDPVGSWSPPVATVIMTDDEKISGEMNTQKMSYTNARPSNAEATCGRSVRETEMDPKRRGDSGWGRDERETTRLTDYSDQSSGARKPTFEDNRKADDAGAVRLSTAEYRTVPQSTLTFGSRMTQRK